MSSTQNTSPSAPASSTIDTNTTPDNDWMGAPRAYSQAVRQIIKNPAPFILFTVVYVVFMMFSWQAASSNEGMSILYSVVPGILFAAALPVYALAVADKRSISISEFMQFNGRRLFYAVVGSIMLSIIIVVSILALLLPIAWTAAWFAYTLFPIVEKGTTPGVALDDSKDLGGNHKAEFWEVMIVPVLVSILLTYFYFTQVTPDNTVSLPVELVSSILEALITGLVICVLAVVYRWLQRLPKNEKVEEAGAEEAEETTQPTAEDKK